MAPPDHAPHLPKRYGVQKPQRYSSVSGEGAKLLAVREHAVPPVASGQAVRLARGASRTMRRWGERVGSGWRACVQQRSARGLFDARAFRRVVQRIHGHDGALVATVGEAGEEGAVRSW
eukprot:194936-Prymnesium_polylepis.1